MGNGNTPDKMIALATTMMALASVAVVARLYARSLRKAALVWDDWTIIAALVFTLGTAICMWVGAMLGGLGRHSEIDGNTGMPVLNTRLMIFFQINYVSLITGTLSTGLTKISVIMFYKRIFRGSNINRLFSWTIWFLIGTCVVWTVAFLFASIFQCHPINANWIGYGGTAEQCINENTMYLAQAFSDSITDLMILLVPIPCIWNLHIPTKQKLAVTGIFLLGILTIAASVTKLVFYYKIAIELDADVVDLTYILTPTVYWPMVESALGITGACLPLLKPILDESVPFARLCSIIPNLTFPSMLNSKSTRSSQRGLVSDMEKGGNATAALKESTSSTGSHSTSEDRTYAYGNTDL